MDLSAVVRAVVGDVAAGGVPGALGRFTEEQDAREA